MVRGGEGARRPRPRVTVGSTRDDVVALQTRLKDLSLATSLAVEACPAVDQAAWGELAGRVLRFVSTDPGSINSAARDQGLALAQELAGWGDKLRAANCAAPIPAPIPVDAPPSSSSDDPYGLKGIFGGVKDIAELVVLALLARALTK